MKDFIKGGLVALIPLIIIIIICFPPLIVCYLIEGDIMKIIFIMVYCLFIIGGIINVIEKKNNIK